MLRFLLGVTLLIVQLLVLAPEVHAVSGRSCRRTCGSRVEADCSGLRKRSFRRCRRDLIRRCRAVGQDVCSTATTTTASSSTTTTTIVCTGQVDCGTFCCNSDTPICAANGDHRCCPSSFPIYCPDQGAGQYCCEAASTCTASTTEKRCLLP